MCVSIGGWYIVYAYIFFEVRFSPYKVEASRRFRTNRLGLLLIRLNFAFVVSIAWFGIFFFRNSHRL